jgi:ketosteroid isomerase-like protein
MTGTDDLADVIERHRAALRQIIRGSPDGFKALYSRGDDATLANPFGPPVQGWDAIARTLEGAAGNYQDGETGACDTLAALVTSELAYTVEMERFTARVGGDDEVRSVTLRVTTVFRPEAGGWRIVHRHADPIAAPRPARSVLQE